jgi:hypothetical protein
MVRKAITISTKFVIAVATKNGSTTEAVETMKKAAQEINRLRTELLKANQFIESLGEGNFSPEDYDGDTYEAVKGACQKFLKANM